MSDCIFCKIASKEIPARIVYENKHVIAFNDINPVAPVHILVIPKEHVENISDLDDTNISSATECIKAIKEIAQQNGIDESGYRVISNVNSDGGQTVFHMHFHVIGGIKLKETII